MPEIRETGSSTFFSGVLSGASVELRPEDDGTMVICVDDYPDAVASHVLDRAETVRLRDWLDTHLGDPPDADPS